MDRVVSPSEPPSSFLRRWMLRLLASAVALFALANLGLWGLDLYMAGQLPEIRSFADYRAITPQVTRVYAADGSVVGEFFYERRTVVHTDSIPRHVKLAAIAAEDGEFYSHEGLDWWGMARAVMVNLRDRRLSQGGSTITQQLARALHLGQQKTLWRKLREVFLARRLDRSLTKDEILVLYLNQIYFGRGRYGIEEASRLYLGKHTSALNVAEAAMLMALIPSPERLNPLSDYEQCLRRRDRILDRMEGHGFIDASARARAQQSSPRLASPSAHQRDASVHARWYVDSVRRRLEATVGPDRLRRAGLRIYTPLRPSLQARLNASIDTAELPDGAEVAGVFIDLATREVVALSGSGRDGRTYFNRAVQARRQAGSTFKSFVYGAGLESGAFDASTRFTNKRLRYGQGDSAWRPKNASGVHDRRRVDLRQALVESLNVVAVQALSRVGIGVVADYARRAGIRAVMSSDLTLALGNVSVTPLELANAYATLGAGGMAGQPVLIRRVETPSGDLVHTESARLRRALTRQSCLTLAGWLVEAVAEGTGRRAQLDGVALAGKTGTTDRGVDAWFAGFTDTIAGVIWVGRDDAKPMARASGGRHAAPIFKGVLQDPQAAVSGAAVGGMLSR